GVAPELTECDEDPQECRGGEEEAHADEMRAEKERCPTNQVGRLEEDREEVSGEVERREEPLGEEDIALREPRVPGVERSAPAKEVVREGESREGNTARDHHEER